MLASYSFVISCVIREREQPLMIHTKYVSEPLWSVRCVSAGG